MYIFKLFLIIMYYHLSNSRGGGNKQRGGPKVPELTNEEEGINKEGRSSWKTWREYYLVHNYLPKWRRVEFLRGGEQNLERDSAAKQQISASVHHFHLTKGFPKNFRLQRHLANRNAI